MQTQSLLSPLDNVVRFKNEKEGISEKTTIDFQRLREREKGSCLCGWRREKRTPHGRHPLTHSTPKFIRNIRLQPSRDSCPLLNFLFHILSLHLHDYMFICPAEVMRSLLVGFATYSKLEIPTTSNPDPALPSYT